MWAQFSILVMFALLHSNSEVWAQTSVMEEDDISSMGSTRWTSTRNSARNNEPYVKPSHYKPSFDGLDEELEEDADDNNIDYNEHEHMDHSTEEKYAIAKEESTSFDIEEHPEPRQQGLTEDEITFLRETSTIDLMIREVKRDLALVRIIFDTIVPASARARVNSFIVGYKEPALRFIFSVLGSNGLNTAGMFRELGSLCLKLARKMDNVSAHYDF